MLTKPKICTILVSFSTIQTLLMVSWFWELIRYGLSQRWCIPVGGRCGWSRSVTFCPPLHLMYAPFSHHPMDRSAFEASLTLFLNFVKFSKMRSHKRKLHFWVCSLHFTRVIAKLSRKLKIKFNKALISSSTLKKV